MEQQKNYPDIFRFEKDAQKKKFIEQHTFADIPNVIPGQDPSFKYKEKAINKVKIKVILNYSYQRDYFEFNLPTEVIYNKEENKYKFLLNDIIDLINSYVKNNKSLFLDSDYSISYYTNEENVDDEDNLKSYYFIGNFPLEQNMKYYINFPPDGVLYLKFRKNISKVKSLRYDIFEEENDEEIEELTEQQKCNAQLNYNTKSKRANEKRIGYIIRKVFEWKGFRKYTENKISLIDAAKEVGLSKKTLDEYFNQIKEGKKYNFDFEKHKNDKVNILRAFVKTKSEKIRQKHEKQKAKKAKEKK